MKGWLVYSPAGYARNRWFASRLQDCAAAHHLALEVRLVPDGRTPADWAGAEAVPPLAVVRAIRPDVSAYLAARGARVVNSAETSRIANDKWRTYQLARELGIPVLPTEALVPPAMPACGFPCVVKSRDGHGGSEVFRVASAADYAALAARLGARPCVAQALGDTPGRDVRVYACGGTVLAAVLRTSTRDFRSNFSLGGAARRVPVADFHRAVVAQLHARLGFDFVGIDFLPHAGGWVLNEIEDVVGTRMLYALGVCDAAQVLGARLAAVAEERT